jgi:hypothetical protein
MNKIEAQDPVDQKLFVTNFLTLVLSWHFLENLAKLKKILFQ